MGLDLGNPALAMDSLGASLHDEEVTGEAVLGPLHIHGGIGPPLL